MPKVCFAANMSQPPALPPSLEDFRDAENLRHLAIAHYVMGGLTALVSCIPIIHVAIGAAIVSGKMPMGSGPGMPPDGRFFGWIFIAFGGLFILLGLTIATLMILTGRWLSARKNKTFCFVIASIECINMPLGTILGVFTLMVLQKPSVAALFNKSEQQQPWVS